MVAHRYELVEIAGEGGMATVWRGTMRGAAGWERPVAIKKMKPEFRALKNYIDMFVEEARVGSELNHPNIVQVYDFCQDAEKSYYLVMEWIDGIDLHSYTYTYDTLGERTPWALVAAVGIGALRGLGAAHARVSPTGSPAPIVHRDVSPANILLGMDGGVKLTDFGLARAKDRVFSLTAPGVVKGKLSYLSPEVAAGEAATPRSDLFSTASTLWEALAGRRLFRGDTDLEIFLQIRRGDASPIEELRPDVPPRLAALLARALAVDPAERPPSADDMASELADIVRESAGIDARALLAESVRWVRDQRDAGRAQREQAGDEVADGGSQVVEPAWSYIIEFDDG